MGHSGFAARRPNAPSLPNFELPPPMSSHHQKNQYAQTHPSAQGHLTSVGNLLTPPSNVQGEGISPATANAGSAAPNHGYSVQHQQQHNGYVWSPQQQGAQYGFQSAGPNQQTFAHHQHRAAPPYELALPPFSNTSGPMSAPATLPTMPSHQHNGSMSATTPGVSAPPHPSPVHAQDGFRPPPTPSYYSQPSATPQQSPFPYSSGASPVQQSPMSAGASLQHRMSPVSAGPISSMTPTAQSPHPYQRPFGQYPLPGPVLSNVQNPNGHMQLVNSNMAQSLPVGFNSGHAAHMGNIYQHAPHSQAQQPTPQNDRPFKCDQCPQSFNRNHDLKRHKRIHLSVKPFPCSHCEKAFSRKDALKRHILVKGCGKASGAQGKENGDSDLSSPDRSTVKVDGGDVKPPGVH